MEKIRLPGRKQLPHLSLPEHGNQAIIHFVTICTKHRRALLASDTIHQIVLQSWLKADSFLVGRYILLPDHIHLFCSPSGSCANDLAAWIRYWKSQVTRQVPCIEKGEMWQRDFWDATMRRGESYANKWDYVRLNPVRHALVNNPDDWPYQGEVHQLPR